MTTLLKQAAQDVQPLQWRALELESIDRPEVDPELEARDGRIAELEATLAKTETEARAAIAAAYKEGQAAAQAAFIRDEAKQLEAFETALMNAGEGLKSRLESLDALALLLCHTALENLFENADDFREIVAGALSKQMANLRRETVLRANVSKADFTDAEALRALQLQLDQTGSFEIEWDDQLESGECRIELRLGQIELSVPQYWAALQAKLRNLAEASGAK